MTKNQFCSFIIAGLAFLWILGLSGCYSEETKRNQATAIESSLPKGCHFKFAGKYEDYPVLVVYCEGHDTMSVSTEFTQACGKGCVAHKPSMAVVIDGKQYELVEKRN